MTRNELLTMIQAYGHGTDAQSLAAQNQALTEAYYDVYGRREWQFRQRNAAAFSTLVVGNPVVPAVPSDFLRVKSIWLNLGTVHNQPLWEHDADELEAWLAQDQGTGAPLYFSLRGGATDSIIVYPRPDKTYQVNMNYVRKALAADFDGSSESPPFPEHFHPVLAWRVLMGIGGFRQRDPQQFNQAKTEYESVLLRMEREDTRQRPTQTHVSPWDGWAMVGG